MLTFIQRSVCHSVLFILWTSICSDAERLFHQRDHSDLRSENQQRAEPITDPHTAEMFLSRYGFLRPVNWEELLLDDGDETDLSFSDLHEFSIEEGASSPHSRNPDQNHHHHDHEQTPHDPHFVSALRDFQKLSGLPVTGVLDEATKDAMNKPRCGVPDVEAELGDESSGEEPRQAQITDQKSLQEKPNSKMVGFQHLDDADVELLDENSSGDDANNHFDDLSKETNSKFAGNFGSTEKQMSNETKNETHKHISDLKNVKNGSTTLENGPSYNDSYNGGHVFDLPSTDHETNPKFADDLKLLDVLLGTMDKKATETEGIPLNQSRESNTFTNVTNGDSNMAFPTNTALRFSGNSSKNSGFSGTSLDFSDNFDPMSNQTFIDRPDRVISNTNDSEMGDLNQTFRSSDDHSDGFVLNTDSANFANETNVLFDPDLNHMALIKASGNSALASLTLENETAFGDNQDRVGDLNDFSLNQRVNNLKDYDTENSTFSHDFNNETMSDFITNSDTNSTLDNVYFENFTNETNLKTLTVFDNDTSLETKHQAITKQLIKTKTAVVDVNLENKTGTTLKTNHQTIAEKKWNLANETNLNSSAIFDPIDNDTTAGNTHQNGNKMASESFDYFETNFNSLTIFDRTDATETKLQNIDKNFTKTKDNSTVDDINFENFINETNLKSLTIFDSIDSNTSVENMHQNVNKTAIETKKNSTFDNMNFENFTNETNLNSLTIFDKIDNATYGETKLQTIDKNSTETAEYSTIDNINFENFINETNLSSLTIFDSIDSNTSVENIQQNVNKTAFETKKNSTFDDMNVENFTSETNLNSLTIFDKTNNATSTETKLQTIDKNSKKNKENSTIADVNFENFINETHFNSPTIFDSIDSNTTMENINQNVKKTAFETKKHSTFDDMNFENFTNETNFNSPMFDPIDSNTTMENIHQNIIKTAIKTKKMSSFGNVHFENFTNDTNLNSSTISDPIDNATYGETKLQTIAKNSTKTEENSTIDDVNFENFINETNLNSLTIFDSIDSNTSEENIYQNVNKTAIETKKNSTFDNVNFENFTNETNLNSAINFDKTNNATSAEIKLQTIDKNSTKPNKNSTIDDVNFENFINETNLNSSTIFDSIDSNTTMEDIHQNVNKTAFETEKNSTFNNMNFENFTNETTFNSPTMFDPIDSNTTMENIHQNIIKTAIKTKKMSSFGNVHFENFTNEINLNSLTIFDKTNNATYGETKFQTIDKNSTKTKENSTIDDADFENFTNETNSNSPINFDKTDNATSAETKLQTSDKNPTKNKENSTFENFTNETSLNSSTISDLTDNATSTETKHQTITKKPTESSDLAQFSGVARRKRHLATLVSKSRARSRREAGGHVAFSKSVLRWRLIGEGYSSQLSVEEQRYVFRLAFRMWSEVCPLEFTEDNASPLEEIDIRLGFGTGRHLGCKQRFDGSGREFAHAWFLGDIHFDDDEHFSGSSAGRGISLLKVAVHEIGHVLGLPHIYRPGSIMQPSYRPHESGFEVDWMDRKAIQSLYGGCKGRFDAVFDWVRRERSPRGDVLIRFNTYFMRRGWYWLYENRNNRTRFGDPVSLQSGWRGLPLDGVDAFVHVWSRRRDHVYFFKGAQFWRYDGEQDQVLRRDPDGRSYPRPISEGFPGVPAPIDTAVYDRRDGNIYFFRGRLVYAFSVDSNRLARGFPKPLRSVFPALDPRDHPESGLDAAYFSYTHNALFLLKDTRFWRVAGARERRPGPRLRKNTLLPHREIDQQWFDICNVHPSALRLTP